MLMPRITILAFLLLLSLSCFSQRWLLSVDFSMGAETRFLASQLFDDWTNRGRSNYFHLSAQSQLSDRLYLGLVGGLTQRSYRQENTRPLISGITRLEYEVFREFFEENFGFIPGIGLEFRLIVENEMDEH